MLKIGDFSKLAMVSVRMLRYYDDKGILSPVSIDKFTGYRYYSTEQLSEIASVKLLQSMGVSLAEIKKLKQNGYDREEMISVLKNCHANKQEECSRVHAQLLTLENAIERLERNEFMSKYNVELKTIPARNIAAVRRVVKQYSDEGELWETIRSEMMKCGVKPAADCYPVCTYMDSEYKEENPDVEVQLAVDGEYKDTETLKFRTTEETQVISVTFTGFYDQITNIYNEMAQWLEENKYGFNGNMFLHYIKSPAEVKDMSELVSELCIPVKKLA